MFENLQVFEDRLEELNLKLYDPQTTADRELYAALMEEYREIEPIVQAYRAYRDSERTIKAAKELLESSNERELKDLAQEELKEHTEKLDALSEEI